MRVMVDLAEHKDEGYIPLKDIVKRQLISQKYLEGIMTDLSKAGVVEGLHGKGGGYKLNREPQDYTVGDILRVTEGDLAPITCLEGKGEGCIRAPECRTLPMWKKLYEMINDYFDGITLYDLMQQSR